MLINVLNKVFNTISPKKAKRLQLLKKIVFLPLKQNRNKYLTV